MLNYDYVPLTEEEAARERYKLLPDGDYDGYVEKSEGKISKSSGNAMAELSVVLYDSEGRPAHVRDFLPFTAQMAWKLLNFCKSAELVQEYKDKKFKPELAQSRNIRATVRTQKGNEIPPDKLNGKPPGSCYPDKNVISDYIIKVSTNTPINDNKGADGFFDDSIPF